MLPGYPLVVHYAREKYLKLRRLPIISGNSKQAWPTHALKEDIVFIILVRYLSSTPEGKLSHCYTNIFENIVQDKNCHRACRNAMED